MSTAGFKMDGALRRVKEWRRQDCEELVQAEQLEDDDDDDDGANDVEDRIHGPPPCACSKSRKRATTPLRQLPRSREDVTNRHQRPHPPARCTQSPNWVGV